MNEHQLVGFVNRDREIEDFDTDLTAVKKGTLPRYQVYTYHGVGGVGKSTLLLEVANICTRQGVPYALINFEGAEPGAMLWPDVVASIATQIGWHNLTEQLRQKIERNIRLQDWVEETQNEFVLQMRYLLIDKGSPIALLFDALDRAEPQTLIWLGRTLESLLDCNKLLVAMTSRRPTQFETTPQVRRHLRSYRLTPFSIEETERQLRRLQTAMGEPLDLLPAATAHEIYRLTAGHPLSNRVMLETIHEEDIEDPVASRQRLVDVLFKRVIDGWILADFDFETQERYRAILEPLSVARMFNLIIAQILIEAYAPSKYHQAGSFQYMEMINEIRQETALIEWDLGKGNYIVDPAARNLFRTRIQYADAGEGWFAVIHRKLLGQYEKWVHEVSGLDRTRYIIEQLYSMACLGQEKDVIWETFTGYIRDYYSGDTQEAFYRRVQLREELDADSELKEVIGIDLFRQMSRYLNRQIRAQLQGEE